MRAMEAASIVAQQTPIAAESGDASPALPGRPGTSRRGPFAEDTRRELPKAEERRELGPRQLAELRRTIPAFKELEARSRRSRGETVW